MTDYITPPILPDPEGIVQQTFDYLQSNVPGWQPSDGNLDVWLAEAFSQIASQIAESATDTQTSIFRYFGQKLAGVPPIAAVPASGSITVTAIDTLGHTLPAGTNVGIQVSDTLIGFQTVADLVIPASASSGSVGIVATDAGSAGNADGTVQLIDEYDFVLTVVLVAPTSGGTDAESDAAYLDRLTGELQLQSPRPILPKDFAQIARRIDEVTRAVCIDGYNPADSTFGNERMVTVVAVNSAGEPISTAANTALDVLFNGDGVSIPALRETTFVVHIASPTYTTIDVSFTAKAWPGYDTTAVHDAAVAAIQDYLSPANWGQPPFSESPSWTNETKVRYLELASVLNGVAGLDYVETLTVNTGTVDITLTGVAPLPQPGTVSGTVDPA